MLLGGNMAKIVIVIVLGVVLLFALCGTALAASPQDIYNDYAAHGKLTQTYSTADLKAYLADAAVHQYGDRDKLSDLDSLVKSLLADRTTFPFTGYEWMLGLGAAVILVAGGLALRRSARSS
jgi:hypothetical protein